METPKLDRLLQDDDMHDFGGPTLVEAPLHLAEGTPYPFPVPVEIARPRHELVSIPNPHAFAAMAAAKPGFLRVRDVSRPTSQASANRSMSRVRSKRPSNDHISPVLVGPGNNRSESHNTIGHSRDAKIDTASKSGAAMESAAATETAVPHAIVSDTLQGIESQLARGTPIIGVQTIAASIREAESLGATTPWRKVEPEALAPETLEGTPLRGTRLVPAQLDNAPVAKIETVKIVETTPEQEWAEFKKIGLGPKRAPGTAAAKLIVSTYRLLGFGILTAIVVALVGYIAITLFYFFSHSWLVPTIVSATDEKVVALQAELATQQNERGRIAGELADAERAMAVEQLFQDKCAAAIEHDLKGRRSALRRVRQLAGAAAETGSQIRESNDEFARASSDRMDLQYGAGMIDRHAMLDGKQQLAQISSSTLSLAERQAAFETQATELSRQAKALDALLANRDVPLSYDVLKIKRDFDASKLAVEKAVESRKTLLASLARQDQIISNLQGSAYLRALADHATVALVPYGNLAQVKPGTPLYACSLEMFWCRQVGTVLEILPGEIQFRHPQRDTLVRGQMIEMRLVDPAAARDDVLFADGKPLGL